MKLAMLLLFLITSFSHALEMENTTYSGDLGEFLPKISQDNPGVNVAFANPIRDKDGECFKKLCVDGVSGNADGLVYFLMNNKTYVYDRRLKSLVEEKLLISHNSHGDGLGTIYLNFKNWNGVAYGSPSGEKVKIKQKDIEKHFYGRPFEYKIVNNFMWLHVKFEARPNINCVSPNEKNSYLNPFKDVIVSQTVWIPYYQPVKNTTTMPVFFFENDRDKDIMYCMND